MLTEALDTDRSTPVHGVTKSAADAFLSRLAPEHATFAKACAFNGGRGQVLALPDAAGRFAMVLIGLGDAPDPFAASAINQFSEGTFSLGEGWSDPNLSALGVLLGNYNFDAYKAQKAKTQQLVRPTGVDGADLARIAEGVTLTRDLINTPANDLGPAELADAAKALAKKYGASLTITDGEALEDGFPMIATVGAASTRPPL
ncbi:MAG: leucyl aminopeptidase family protein, partial [Pseudomonadota bacterium]